MDRRDFFSGCLLGQCLGDALGFLVEGDSRGACTAYVNEVLRPKRIPELKRGPFAFGQYSDDSQLARELIQSYVDRRRFDPADYARRIAAIFEESRIVGYGRATDQAADRLIRGVPWQEAGTPAPSAGNGTAMRAAPIGLIFCDDQPGLAQAAHDQSRITHQDPRCSAGSAIVAGVVAHVLRNRTVVTRTLWLELLDLADRFSEPFRERLEACMDWVELGPDQAFDLIAGAGQEDETGRWNGITPFVIPSVLWSLYAFLRTPGDYWETVCTAIAAGGDVDTTAAMAGAMSGALNGMSKLPGEFLDRLQDQGTWDRGDLVRLANDAHAVKVHIL